MKKENRKNPGNPRYKQKRTEVFKKFGNFLPLDNRVDRGKPYNNIKRLKYSNPDNLAKGKYD
jgi:hypothetical protein